MRRYWPAAAAAMLLWAGPARAQTLGTGSAAPRMTLRWSFKATGVASAESRDGLWRLRAEPRWRLGSGTTFDLAYEQRVRLSSAPSTLSGLGLGVLPAESPPPYRLTPLDWEIAGGGHGSWRHEIDRAVLHTSVGRLNLGVGRQAIGWGRGVLFGAVDLFSPFSPFEVDREWRRGVDAVRIEAPLGPHLSTDVVMSFGSHAGDAAYAGRLRGYAGTIDVEVVGGRRAHDTFGGGATSFVMGPGEMHVEIAAFRTQAVQGSTLFGHDRTVIKAVVGGSTRLPIGSGLLAYVEYHYSGFGAAGAQAILPALDDSKFTARVLRGDTQILTRHALAFVGSYEWSPLVAGSTALVVEPSDGSGVATPSFTFTFTDQWSLLASAYLAFGHGSDRDALGSAYGSAPTTVLVQVRLYR